MKCDLHVHSNFSDGIFTPQKLIDMAKQKRLDCIAITDHDTFDGVKVAAEYAKQVGMGYIVGAELSCMGDREVHLLAYNVNMDDPSFDSELAKIVGLRQQRNALLVEKLHQYGVDIDLGSLKSHGTIGRGVIAREMVRLGYCKDVPEVFDKYLGVNKCCYVKSERLSPVDGIRFALRFGGIPVLAHPKQLRLDFSEFEKFLRPLVLAGLGGIEAQYFTHNNDERKFYTKMAKKYKLIVTGGSDFHDYTHGVVLGTQSFSPSAYTRKILGI